METEDNRGRATPRRSLRVLVVDDEPLVADLLASFLSMIGHLVTVAEDGNKGLAMFQTEGYDLVITDNRMPGMKGGEMAAAIKRLAPAVPIIMLRGDREETVPPGVDYMADKPISLARLLEVVNQATTA